MATLKRLSKLFIVLLFSISLVTLSADESSDSDEAVVSKAEVVILTESNFEHLTQAATGATTGDWFVKMYAPWCGHCQRLEPVWSELASEIIDKGVNVAKVDITANRAIGERFGIKGFPTLLFMRKGLLYTYKGPRTKEALANFATGGYESVESKPVPPHTRGLPSIIKSLKDDLHGAQVGKLPSPTTIAVLTGAAFLVAVLIFLLRPKHVENPKRE